MSFDVVPFAVRAIPVIVGMTAGPAFAAPLSYISSVGSDVGDCSNAATPCRTLAYAMPKTSPGGEIKALLAGNYSGTIIGKSITLTGVPGATIMVGTDNAVGLTVQATTDAIVSINGFTLNGTGVGGVGVKVTKAAELILRDCTIKNFKNWGVQIVPSVATKFSIEDTFIANVTYGVFLDRTGSGSTSGVVHRSTIIGKGSGGIGVFLSQASRTRVSDSLIGHFEYGIYTGAAPGNVLRITRNTVSQNANGVYIEKDVGTLAETAHDNFIAGNTIDLDPVGGAPLSNVGTR